MIMKYIYFLIIPIMFLIGCSSSDSKKVDEDIKNLKMSLDSLKTLNKINDKTLDSLNKANKLKEEKLLQYQHTLDSLKKNFQEEESGK